MHKRRGRPVRSPSSGREQVWRRTGRPAQGCELGATARDTRPLAAPGKPVCEPHDSTGEPGALCCDLDYVTNSTKSPIGAGDRGKVRHIMRRTTGPRETGNSLFACQSAVCSGRGSEPETAHVCNALPSFPGPPRRSDWSSRGRRVPAMRGIVTRKPPCQIHLCCEVARCHAAFQAVGTTSPHNRDHNIRHLGLNRSAVEGGPPATTETSGQIVEPPQPVVSLAVRCSASAWNPPGLSERSVS